MIAIILHMSARVTFIAYNRVDRKRNFRYIDNYIYIAERERERYLSRIVRNVIYFVTRVYGGTLNLI